MADDAGHRYSFGAPSKGWPKFGPDGKVIRDEEPEHRCACGAVFETHEALVDHRYRMRNE